MPTRPSLESIQQSTSSELIHPTRAPIHKLCPLFAQLTFHVVPDKLDGDLGKIYEVIEELGGQIRPLQNCRYVISALKGRPRLVRALGREWIDVKTILHVEFVHETFQFCLDAAASGRVPHLPSREEYTVNVKAVSGQKRARSPASDMPPPPTKKRRKINEEGLNDPTFPSKLPDIGPLPEDVTLEDIPRYCVLRPCPRKCPNQDIIDAIKPIYDEREFEENQQKNSNVLSYRRSMSILKSVPRRIKSGKEARKLQDLGEKVEQRIDEYLETGRIEESEQILASPRYAAMKAFASVYTIGHHTAKDLHDRHHCRTLEDVRAHYASIAEESEEVRLKVKERRRREGGMTHVDIVEEWMQLKDELDSKIPRQEVEEIADCVMEHLEVLLPGCQYTICGGYRRGKQESNDVDVVFCPPDYDQDVGLLQDLTRRLSTLDIVTHVLHITKRAANTPIHSSPNNFDNLDKAFVIFRLPGPGRKHRRVDLISAPKERYAAAVLSWSGSMMFERDLRRYAEDRGLKFRAGLIEANTGREINYETEREIFEHLRLRYVPPELRNADG